MTPEAQNVAIAEACGWLDLQRPSGIMKSPKGHPLEYDYPPNYTRSLDAMALAEATLPNEGAKRLYIDILVSLMEPGEFTVMAPAPKRAKAFLIWAGRYIYADAMLAERKKQKGTL